MHSLVDFLKYFIYLFLEGGEGERGEKYQCVVASRTPPTGDLAHNPGICPDWELNRRPFSSQPVLNPLNYTSQGSLVDFCMCSDQESNPNSWLIGVML